jgi:3-dehydro-L-gulonate 2-dehydrogenase
MSQFSYGKMEWHLKRGSRLPEPGGFDRNGELTIEPGEILETGRVLPTGFWKGSGLSMVLDLAASLLTGGKTTREIGQLPGETDLSQVFISIDPKRHHTGEEMEQMIRQTLDFVTGKDDGARFPGQGSQEKWHAHLENGVEIPDEVWQEILSL